MEQQTSQESSSSTDKLAAVGRKVKSALGTHQQPSVRILRSSPQKSGGNVVPEDPPTQPSNEKAASSGFMSSVRSMFGRKDDSTTEQAQSDEYDADTVDLLDVVGR